MPETLERMFAELRTVQPPAPYAPPSAVRRRGRRRAYRSRTAVGGAALAVGALGAAPVVVGALTGPSPLPPTPSAPPPPTSSRVAPSPSPSGPAGGLLLEPADLGPGAWRSFEAEIMSNRDMWGNGDLCEYDSADYPSLPRQAAVETVAWRSAAGTVTEVVERYAPGWGARNLDDVRAVIAFCAERDGWRLTVERTGFAGDESLLARIDAAGHVRYFAVVRVGDLVATVHTSTGDPDYTREVATRAADRLG
jgi:hypothetical protein